MRGTRLRNYQLILFIFGLFVLASSSVASSEAADSAVVGSDVVNGEADAGPAQPEPLRVASMNYCIDFVLERWGQHEDANFTLFPAGEHQGRIEQMLQIQPDIIIAGQFNSPITLNNFRNHGLPVTVLAEPNSFAGSSTFFRELATALRQPALAHSDLAALTDPILSVPEGGGRSALALQANQWSFGGNNLLNELLEYLGLENLAARNGDGLVRINLEDVIAWQPEVLLLDGKVNMQDAQHERTTATAENMPTTFALAHLNLMHKSLRNYQQRSDVLTIYLPRELSGCMGQRLPEAIAILRYQLQHSSSQDQAPAAENTK
ncbi:MAG: ABC transporter substrate-binding protein [Idiomarina sp.]|nr:ABC transporter substrate-binding protein [Idiomarina sp.]